MKSVDVVELDDLLLDAKTWHPYNTWMYNSYLQHNVLLQKRKDFKMLKNLLKLTMLLDLNLF